MEISPIALTLVALVAVINLTGCGTVKNALSSKPSASPAASQASKPATPAAQASADQPAPTSNPAIKKTTPLIFQAGTTAPTSVPTSVAVTPGASKTNAPAGIKLVSRPPIVLGQDGAEGYYSVRFFNRSEKPTRLLVNNGEVDTILEDGQDQVVFIERRNKAISYDLENTDGRTSENLNLTPAEGFYRVTVNKP